VYIKKWLIFQNLYIMVFLNFITCCWFFLLVYILWEDFLSPPLLHFS